MSPGGKDNSVAERAARLKEEGIGAQNSSKKEGTNCRMNLGPVSRGAQKG